MIAPLLATALAVSLVIALVLLVRAPVARLFGAQAAYALWLAPLARAIWPMLPGLPGTSGEGGVGGAAPTIIITTIPSAPDGNWATLLAVVWAGGAIAYLGAQLLRHHLFLRDALANGQAVSLPGIPFDVIASRAVDGPVATGLLHPIILVPADFATRFSPEQQQLALLHETLHHRRGDIWAAAAALLVTAALWFNPLAHLALGAFRRDMEAACDRSVLAATGTTAAPLYGETILRCAARPVPRSLCALTSLDELKGRLTMLSTNHSRQRRLAGLGIAAAVSATGLALAFPASASQESETRIEKHIIKHGDGDKSARVEKFDESTLPDCNAKKVEIEAGGGSDQKKQRVKVLVCAKDGQSDAELKAALQKAIQHLDEDGKEMDSSLRADIRSKLEAKLRELR